MIKCADRVSLPIHERIRPIRGRCGVVRMSPGKTFSVTAVRDLQIVAIAAAEIPIDIV